jgi:hypothetical protein
MPGRTGEHYTHDAMAQKKGTIPEPATSLRKYRVDRLFEAADRLAAVPLSPLTEAEVEEEVQAVRVARRT